MKRITYRERSKFYSKEVTKSLDDIILLSILKNNYNIDSAIICPCASGVYLDECSKLFKKSYFIDIEENMINIVNRSILKNKISNIKAINFNIININNLNIKSDCIFVLNQGIQYLNYSEFERFLNNIYFTVNYIVLHLFDFNSKGRLSYYNSNIKDNCFYFSKSFLFKGKQIKRYNKHIHDVNYTDFYYEYFYENKVIFKTNFRLYNYNYKWLEEMLKKNNKFYIQEKIMCENGSYVLVLNKERSN